MMVCSHFAAIPVLQLELYIHQSQHSRDSTNNMGSTVKIMLSTNASLSSLRWFLANNGERKERQHLGMSKKFFHYKHSWDALIDFQQSSHLDAEFYNHSNTSGNLQSKY
jgi:hypothetical protein